jgi:hypothetical protein
MSRGPRPIGELLRTGNISNIKAEAKARRELAARVRSELPAAEAAHVVGAHVDDAGCLVVGMDSAAWAARLRYSATVLLGKPLRVKVTAPGGADGT